MFLDDFYEEDVVENANIHESRKTNVGVGVGLLVPPPLKFRHEAPKKKQLNYDDILAGMNLCVKDGKLHTLNTAREDEASSYQTGHGHGHGPGPGYDEEINNSPEVTNEQHRMITMQKQQLYKRAVWLEQLKRESQRRRINAVKTKKMLFSNANTNVVMNRNLNSYNGNNKMFGLIGK